MKPNSNLQEHSTQSLDFRKDVKQKTLKKVARLLSDYYNLNNIPIEPNALKTQVINKVKEMDQSTNKIAKDDNDYKAIMTNQFRAYQEQLFNKQKEMNTDTNTLKMATTMLEYLPKLTKIPECMNSQTIDKKHLNDLIKFIQNIPHNSSGIQITNSDLADQIKLYYTKLFTPFKSQIEYQEKQTNMENTPLIPRPMPQPRPIQMIQKMPKPIPQPKPLQIPQPKYIQIFQKMPQPIPQSKHQHISQPIDNHFMLPTLFQSNTIPIKHNGLVIAEIPNNSCFTVVMTKDSKRYYNSLDSNIINTNYSNSLVISLYSKMVSPQETKFKIKWVNYNSKGQEQSSSSFKNSDINASFNLFKDTINSVIKTIQPGMQEITEKSPLKFFNIKLCISAEDLYEGLL
ncbi:hypothetical protein M9Y10_034014 [Tritrichomonas musculus]|uniref:Uncharacterized protein n=1 Tax=Tritrichomonas musculus TaxID=1915356 RepID=A0ABR2KDQ8_9EUKA